MCQLADQTNLGRNNVCSGNGELTNMIKGCIQSRDCAPTEEEKRKNSESQSSMNVFKAGGVNLSEYSTP